MIPHARHELGCHGHLIVAHSCLWSRHTQVGPFRVSSIGEYCPAGSDTKRRIGGAPDSYYESMVFVTLDRLVALSEGCGCREVESWSELERRSYATAGEAQAGHERLVEKYSMVERPPKRRSGGEYEIA